MKYFLSCGIILLIPFLGLSQNDSLKTKKELRKEIPCYVGVSIGLNSSNFRDFATSPLVYNGLASYFLLSVDKNSLWRESKLAGSLSSGNYSSNYNDHVTSSKVKVVSINYSLLYRLNKLSTVKLNFKVGGLFDLTSSFRVNESLQNNAMGMEFFPTLFGSVKVSRDISREEQVSKKFLFIKYKLKQRTRKIDFRLNLGLINSNFRNGFVYSGQSGLLNEFALFDDYQFNMFSGFRLSTEFDYLIYLENKNALKFSYLWEAYKTGSEMDNFEMAHHVFKITLLFNTNNK